jgi:hypothetical protein
MLEAVVGSVAAEKALLYLQSHEQVCGREIAASFDLAQSQVQKHPLRALLNAALDRLPIAEQQRCFRRRTRPRRSGKAL